MYKILRPTKRIKIVNSNICNHGDELQGQTNILTLRKTHSSSVLNFPISIFLIYSRLTNCKNSRLSIQLPMSNQQSLQLRGYMYYGKNR